MFSLRFFGHETKYVTFRHRVSAIKAASAQLRPNLLHLGQMTNLFRHGATISPSKKLVYELNCSVEVHQTILSNLRIKIQPVVIILDYVKIG